MDSMFIGSLEASHSDRPRFIREVRGLMDLFAERKHRPQPKPGGFVTGYGD